MSFIIITGIVPASCGLKNEQIDDWNDKLIEFQKDLDELGTAITDFFVHEE